jgi:hypothetical protein
VVKFLCKDHDGILIFVIYRFFIKYLLCCSFLLHQLINLHFFVLLMQFFKTEPHACDPSSLPQYPPSKEMDAKRRDEEARRFVILTLLHSERFYLFFCFCFYLIFVNALMSFKLFSQSRNVHTLVVALEKACTFKFILNRWAVFSKQKQF